MFISIKRKIHSQWMWKSGVLFIMLGYKEGAANFYQNHLHQTVCAYKHFFLTATSSREPGELTWSFS